MIQFDPSSLSMDHFSSTDPAISNRSQRYNSDWPLSQLGSPSCRSTITPLSSQLAMVCSVKVTTLSVRPWAHNLLQTCTQWLSEFDFFTAANIIQPRLTQHWIKYRTYIEKTYQSSRTFYNDLISHINYSQTNTITHKEHSHTNSIIIIP